MPAPILTLTTDFGQEGPYVAALKGVVLALAPGTVLVDISHSVPPQDVALGSFFLETVAPYFPGGTVHLAVVDPGVGTDRRLIAARVDDHWFVLPDNGLIEGVSRGRTLAEVHELRNPALRRVVVSATFHGRDILAPAAAHLLKGGNPAELGPTVDSIVLPDRDRGDVAEMVRGADPTGRVIYVDPFGNLITDIHRNRIEGAPADSWTIEVGGRSVVGFVRTYGDRPAGELVALVGSSDRVEVAVVNGGAAALLAIGRGASVVVRRRKGRTR